MKNLVIVESPAKSKTIEKYLGKDYVVMASYGHVRDLAKAGLGIDIDDQFNPHYEVLPDKEDVVKKLKAAVKKAENVYLATDLDLEGEAIAWHLQEALNLDAKKVQRIVFNEITKSAIQAAIASPKQINYDLVNAQQARRVLDRIVGFEMSPILWKKVKPGLSAGRVQSIAVRLIVDRENDIQAFNSEPFFSVTSEFVNDDGVLLEAELNTRIDTAENAESLLKNCQKASFVVEDITKTEGTKKPQAPFITSSLQQEASRKCGFSVSRTMSLAQKLYEAGHITYMRTDSTSLSQDALTSISKFVASEYGKDYAQKRTFGTSAKGAQEAHEAIRPTQITQKSAGNDEAEQRLYQLIWQRTLASQMADAKVERTKAVVSFEDPSYHFVAKGEVITFEGFLKCYKSEQDEVDSQSKKLPNISKGDSLTYQFIQAKERFTKAPARYMEASLVKKLEELGIGRPSTYAPTISTIQKRQYVEKTERPGTERPYQVLTLKDASISKVTETETIGIDKGKLFPTDMGRIVTEFLAAHFDDIMDYQFTAHIEEKIDHVGSGETVWSTMISEFYDSFHPVVVDVEENSERAVGERSLGKDPKSGKMIYVRMGRYGPMAQIGETPTSDEDPKPKYAGLQKTQSLQDITLEEALKLFDLPREVGAFEELPITVAIGRFGPYCKHNDKFVSLGKENDPYTVSLETCIELIKEKRKQEKEKYIHQFTDHDPPIDVLNGRYGPYISMDKKNFKIPKDVDPKKLTIEQCIEIINTPKKPKRSKKGSKKS